MVHILTGERSRQLIRAASVGTIAEGPSFCEEMELVTFAAEAKLTVVRLSLGTVHQGFLTLAGDAVLDSPLWDLFVAQATTALALIGEREQSQRGAMKDPQSSAYTFAYFVDVAGREIDKAVRHSRRFALATVSLAGAADGSTTSNIDLADRLLAAVRDTDIVARIDETEFYLLLPETGGIGAHACRRRVMQQLGATNESKGVLMGLAAFPHDGRDLSQLLRVAKYRAEASARSVVLRQELWRLPMGELLDAVLWDAREETDSIDAPRAIELPVRDVLDVATAAVQEATRAGATWLLTSQRSGLGVGSAVRAAVSRDRDTPRIESVDLSGVDGCRDLEVLALVTQHGAYTLLGRISADIMRAVHSGDPLFVDLVADRLGAALGTRFVY
jgi:GGDEF domain-containing protein